ncbi:hypothetical protein MARU1_002870 [Malassezia arunalokei]|jgi:RNA polymerase II transcription factor B subunit 5|uniref:General transcription and DNA repair factor IIH subunit TFB5 n=1 Tax=Malassezia arunalokei TaxID=1514897 RepID=A0AAJ5Z173_9BASI|nr:hypothetical protein MARU1_002870 [Malassezia arunalokei]
MRALAGSLLTCDVAVKQMILAIDERMPCIIMDLDDTHMLVNSKMVEQLRTMLEAEVRGPALTAV